MFGMSNYELYRRIEHQLDFRKDDIGRYLEVMIDIVGEQNKNIGEHKEWLSDIANRLESALASKLENQGTKAEEDFWLTRYNNLQEKCGKLEAKIEYLETQTAITEKQREIEELKALNEVKDRVLERLHSVILELDIALVKANIPECSKIAENLMNQAWEATKELYDSEE